MTITSDKENVRIDVFLTENTEFSRNKISQVIKKGEVLVNNKKVSASYKVKIGDVINYNEPVPDIIDLEPEKMDLDIVYEDDYLVIIKWPFISF